MGRCRACCSIVGCTAFLLLIGVFIWFVVQDTKDPWYYAAIDRASGVDPATDLGRPALDPVFDVTLRVFARTQIGSECFDPGTSVEVSYRGVLLATGPVPQLCAPAGKKREQTVTAWGTGVHLPGFALDGLAADSRRGAMAFDVTVKIPSSHGNDHHGMLVSCRARRVADAAALDTACSVASADLFMSTSHTGVKQPGVAN